MDWFEQRIGMNIVAVTPEGAEVEIKVLNNYHVQWLFTAQQLGWQFKDKVRVHRSAEACLACEG